MTTFHLETYLITFLGTVRHCTLVIIQEKVGHIGVMGGGLGNVETVGEGVVCFGVVGEGLALFQLLVKALGHTLMN